MNQQIYFFILNYIILLNCLIKFWLIQNHFIDLLLFFINHAKYQAFRIEPLESRPQRRKARRHIRRHQKPSPQASRQAVSSPNDQRITATDQTQVQKLRWPIGQRVLASQFTNLNLQYSTVFTWKYLHTKTMLCMLSKRQMQDAML